MLKEADYAKLCRRNPVDSRRNQIDVKFRKLLLYPSELQPR